MSDLPNAETLLEIAQLNGMIWWLASDLAAEDGFGDGTAETWVALAEKHWRSGIRYQTRFISPS